MSLAITPAMNPITIVHRIPIRARAFSQPFVTAEEFPVGVENARYILIFFCHTRNIVAPRGRLWQLFTLPKHCRKTAMAERLTESLIKALKAPSRGERFLWDAELTGFAIKVFAPTRAHPKGARTFVLSYWLDG